jgi:hypothetical protein
MPCLDGHGSASGSVVPGSWLRPGDSEGAGRGAAPLPLLAHHPPTSAPSDRGRVGAASRGRGASCPPWTLPESRTGSGRPQPPHPLSVARAPAPSLLAPAELASLEASPGLQEEGPRSHLPASGHGPAGDVTLRLGLADFQQLSARGSPGKSGPRTCAPRRRAGSRAGGSPAPRGLGLELCTSERRARALRTAPSAPAFGVGKLRGNHGPGIRNAHPGGGNGTFLPHRLCGTRLNNPSDICLLLRI